jgi:hypothetical protein
MTLQLSETSPKTFCQGIFLSASVLLRELNKFTAVPMLTTGKGRIKRAAQHLDSAEMKLYFNFLEFIMVPLNEFNTAFQVNTYTFTL